MTTLVLSSPAILDCLMMEIAVTRVSIALANSPLEASETAFEMASLDNVLFLFMRESNSSADICTACLGGGGPVVRSADWRY